MYRVNSDTWALSTLASPRPIPIARKWVLTLPNPPTQLRPGDWIMLDNLRVQHGRLPYEADPKQKRVLLTVYTTPLPSH